ncbi:MAG TPA: FtsX-like permease family protein [Vicinamibacterales bacterium]|jgi:putative ABC transport system permease protein
MQIAAWLESVAQDVRHGWRTMLRSRVSTAVAVATLAIGIGVNATVFTVTNAVLFKGFAGVHRNDPLFLVFAAIALLLASIGLYTVVAHSVSQRTQEIGVRMAVGADARDILTLVGRQGLLPSAIGLIIGIGASLAVNRLLASELVQVSPSDPVSLAVASAALIGSATLGCLIPARRAMRVDPLVALRHE